MAVKKKAAKAEKVTKVAKKPVAKKVAKKVAKPAAKKTVAKKVTAKAVAKPAAVKSVDKAYSKSQVLGYIAEQASIGKREAADAYNALVGLLGAHLKSKVGAFTFPGLCKAVVIRKPATKARKGINPFTKEPTTFKAKPARNIVKIRPLKALKSMV